MIVILCLLCALVASTARAQPEWVTAAVQAAPIPPTHRDAQYLTLADDVAITFDDDGRALSTARILYRVLRPGGAAVGKLTISTSPNRTLRRVRGWRIESGKEPETIGDDDVVVMNPLAVAGYYSDIRQAVVEFSRVQPDDLVAFEYEVEESGPTARFQSNSFQGRQPVARSTYSITLPPRWGLQTAGYGLEPVQRTETGNTTVWSASALPYEPLEPLAPPSRRAGRWLIVNVTGGSENSFADWSQVAEWTRARTEPAAVPDGSVSALSTTLLSGGDLPWRKLAAAARFVQNELRYVALELGEGGWIPRPAGETLRNRFGDCKDKATLLRSILRSAGIPSAAVLASTAARVFPETPSPFQFNHLIVAVPESALGIGHPYGNAIADGWFFFDPTDWTVPPGSIPPVLEGSRVFIADKGSAAPVRLPSAGASSHRVSREAEGTLGPDGLASASVRMVFRGEQAYTLRGALRSTHDATPLWLSYVREAIPDAAIRGAVVADSTDSLAVTFSISGRGLLSIAGVENMFRVNLLKPVTPDRLTARTRVNPLWLGPASTDDIRIRWRYDGSLAGPDTLIERSLSCRGNSFTARVLSRKKDLEFLLTITRSNDSIPATEYGSVRTYLSELEHAVAPSIQLRKILQ